MKNFFKIFKSKEAPKEDTARKFFEYVPRREIKHPISFVRPFDFGIQHTTNIQGITGPTGYLGAQGVCGPLPFNWIGS